MAHFIPSLPLNEHKAELIFLIDQSESMTGENFMMAKAALKVIEIEKNLNIHALCSINFHNLF